MKMRKYIITTGQYDSFRIVAVVEGDVKSRTIQKLEREFQLRYGFPAPLKSPLTDSRSIMDRFDARKRAIERAKENGLDPTGFDHAEIAAQFIFWLIREHGFRLTEIPEVHIN